MQYPQPLSHTAISLDYFFMALGAFLAAFAIEVFLIPNNAYRRRHSRCGDDFREPYLAKSFASFLLYSTSHSFI